MRTVTFEFVVDAPLERVWAFHAEPLNLPRIMPGPMRVLRRAAPLRAGGEIALQLPGIRWLLRVIAANPPHQFVDEQVHGPWACWRHTHRFEPVDETRTRVFDQIEFALPLWPLCAPAELFLARIGMPLLMVYRRRATLRLLENKNTGAV